MGQSAKASQRSCHLRGPGKILTRPFIWCKLFKKALPVCVSPRSPVTSCGPSSPPRAAEPQKSAGNERAHRRQADMPSSEKGRDTPEDPQGLRAELGPEFKCPDSQPCALSHRLPLPLAFAGPVPLLAQHVGLWVGCRAQRDCPYQGSPSFSVAAGH